MNVKLPLDLTPITEGLRSISDTMRAIRDSVALLPQVAETLADIQEGVRKLCEGRFPMEVVRGLEEAGGIDRGRWGELAEAGVFTLRVPEAGAGVGLGAREGVLVFEELGRALVPGPLVATSLAAGVVDGEVEQVPADESPEEELADRVVAAGTEDRDAALPTFAAAVADHWARGPRLPVSTSGPVRSSRFE